MNEATAILKKYWGYDQFRSPQQEIIDSVVGGYDTIALLPTGAGKSICYQVPALLLKGKTLVISPLIALMQDQVDQLFARGIPAKALHSNLSYRETDAILDHFVHGTLSLLYVAPERLSSPLFQARIKKVQLSLIAVDESHCISQWGYDFRPAYLTISDIRDIHPTTPVIALTATATQKVLEDISSRLQLRNPAVFKKSFARTNLSLSVCLTEDKDAEIRQLLQQTKGSCLVYTRNRKDTMALSGWLQQCGISSVAYHGGMDRGLRDKNQHSWITGNVRAIVCTNAFGMGIDKPDVRLVIHTDVPPSLEEYYQEAGRAGRDGQPAVAVAILSQSDLLQARKHADDQFPSIEQISHAYEKICRYYKIAFGSGEFETFDFSLQDIAGFLSMPLRKVFSILNLLEREGWINLSEGIREPSRVWVHADRDDIVQYESIKPQTGELLVQLLRSYEGVSSAPVTVDEGRLAKILSTEQNKISHQLMQLQSEGMISYFPRSESPRITFLRARPESGNFSIDKQAYRQRKKQATDRLEAILEYMQQEQKCRQALILNYFGEKGTGCGRCDLCLGTMETGFSEDTANRILLHLREQAGKNPVSFKSYVRLYPIFQRRRIMQLFKIWSEEGILTVDNRGNIVLLTK